jgi:hypothetical protein
MKSFGKPLYFFIENFLLSTISYILNFGLTSDGNARRETSFLVIQKACPMLTQDLPKDLIDDGLLVRYFAQGDDPVRGRGF